MSTLAWIAVAAVAAFVFGCVVGFHLFAGFLILDEIALDAQERDS